MRRVFIARPDSTDLDQRFEEVPHAQEESGPRSRRATGHGTCARCGGPYEMGDELMGMTGDWSHDYHFMAEELRAAWAGRAAAQARAAKPFPGGGWETARKHH
jgi:hypothetical protein